MSEVNIELLREGVEWIEQQAELPLATRSWFQTVWVIPEDARIAMYRHEPTCGSAYCFAGYIGQRVNPLFQKRDFVDGEHVAEAAEKALGITEEQGDKLFDGDNSAEDIRRIAEEIAGQKL